MEQEGSWTPQVGTENQYQYNGKELNEDLGLNWYDYGARWYDPAVGRWWSVDPMAEATAGYSVYTYALNNPALLIDPNGMLAGNPFEVMEERREKQKARNEERDRDIEENADNFKSGLPEAYYVNDAGLSTKSLINIFTNATAIFAKPGNGYPGLKFNQVSKKVAMEHKEAYEKQMFLALINKKNTPGKVTDPGKSHVPRSGRIGVFDETSMTNFPFNGWLSWVDIGNSSISEHRGDKEYAAGYVVAHEILHQMTGIAAYYLTGNGTRYNFHRDEGRPHLNTDGHNTKIPYGPSDKLRPEEEILKFHKDIIYIFKK